MLSTSTHSPISDVRSHLPEACPATSKCPELADGRQMLLLQAHVESVPAVPGCACLAGAIVAGSEPWLNLQTDCLALPAAAQCLLDSLLAAKDESGAGMERHALRDELMTLLVAGQETSAINLAWTLAFLAHHPAAQERAAGEVQQVRGPSPPGPLGHPWSRLPTLHVR